MISGSQELPYWFEGNVLLKILEILTTWGKKDDFLTLGKVLS